MQVMLRYAGTLKVNKYKQKKTEKTLASQRTRKWQLGQTSPGRLSAHLPSWDRRHTEPIFQSPRNLLPGGEASG